MTEPNHSDHELLVETLRRLYSMEHAYHAAASELVVVKHRLQQADYHADNDLADKVHELNTALEECKAELETLREDAKNDKYGAEAATKRLDELTAKNESLHKIIDYLEWQRKKAELEALRKDVKDDKYGAEAATKQIGEFEAALHDTRDETPRTAQELLYNPFITLRQWKASEERVAELKAENESLRRKSVDSRLLLDALDDYVAKAIRTYDFEYNMGPEDVDGLTVSGYLDLTMFSDILNGLLRDVAKGDDD